MELGGDDAQQREDETNAVEAQQRVPGHEGEEPAQILRADAGVEPDAVVVEAHNADVAHPAVVRARRAEKPTRVAPLEGRLATRRVRFLVIPHEILFVLLGHAARIDPIDLDQQEDPHAEANLHDAHVEIETARDLVGKRADGGRLFAPAVAVVHPEPRAHDGEVHGLKERVRLAARVLDALLNLLPPALAPLAEVVLAAAYRRLDLLLHDILEAHRAVDRVALGELGGAPAVCARADRRDQLAT